MENFLKRLKSKNYQNRIVGIVENGTWAPSAGKVMKEIFEQMKNIDICEQSVTIKSRLDEESKQQLEEISKEILKK